MQQDQLNTPCYVVDVDSLRHNLEILRGVQDRTGAHILLAQKAFSCYGVYPIIAEYLTGATASGLYEAKLCHEEMPGRENHIYNPAFREEDMEEILAICDHIVFNSPQQLRKFGPRAKAAGLQVGLRINPEFSTQTDHAIYDPCAPGSRLGTRESEFDPSLLALLDGLHFHTLCEQDSDDLEATLNAFEAKFGQYLHQLRWVNFGGGHHITRPGYNIQRLERLIQRTQERYGVEVYLEPGEAIALNAGYLHTRVLEVREMRNNDTQSCEIQGEVSPTLEEAGVSNLSHLTGVAILDSSAACHMPDVIEMPYTPPLQGAIKQQDAQEPTVGYRYRLGGPTCLAGDIIGDYIFDHQLEEGEILTFEDMAIYSMVKNNTFNGMPLPSIYIKDGDTYQLWKEFGYSDFKCRL